MTLFAWIFRYVAAGMLCLSLTHCASTPEKEAKKWASILEQRLSRAWIQQAKVITLGEQTVYFQGEAEVGPELPLVGWAGDISGEVLIVTSKSVTACSGLRIAPTGATEVQGESHTTLKEPPNDWEHLVLR